MKELEQIKSLVISGDAKGTIQLVQEMLDQGVSPNRILDDALVSGMMEVGAKMESGMFFIPEVLVSARAMKAALEILKPRLMADHVAAVGLVILTTVEGDVHDIGKNLVKVMMEGAGFEIIDLGVNVPAVTIIEAVKKHHPQILGLSALLTTAIVRMKEIIEGLKREGLRDHVKVMVGGAAVSNAYAEQIGADAYSPDCADAAKRAKELISCP